MKLNPVASPLTAALSLAPALVLADPPRPEPLQLFSGTRGAPTRLVAASSTDGQILVVFDRDSEPRELWVSRSDDYGRSWTRPERALGVPALSLGDIELKRAPSGPWVLAHSEFSSRNELVVQASADGRTFGPPVRVSGSEQPVWIDRLEVSGNTWFLSYTTSSQNLPLVLAQSSDGGQTWTRQTLGPDVPDPDLERARWGQTPGAWWIAYNDRRQVGLDGTVIRASRSTDRGATWSEPIDMPPLPGQVRPIGGPLGVYSSPVRPDEVAVVWQAGIRQGSQLSSDEIWMSRSVDGVRWTAPERLWMRTSVERTAAVQETPSGLARLVFQETTSRIEGFSLVRLGGETWGPYTFESPSSSARFLVPDGGGGWVLGAITDVWGDRNVAVVATRPICGFVDDVNCGGRARPDGGLEAGIPDLPTPSETGVGPESAPLDLGLQAGPDAATTNPARPEASRLLEAREPSCGCRSAARPDASWGWWIALFALGLVLRRRAYGG